MSLLSSTDTPSFAGATTSGRRSSIIGTIALFCLCLAVTLIPIWLVDIPPLVDLPNHISRMHILTALANDPVLQESYVVAWSLLPNLAMDIFVVSLTSIFSVFDASRLFVAATVINVFVGTLVLHYATHKRISVWHCLVFLALYNQVLAWGFLNFLFGLGTAFLAAGGWILLRNKSPIIRWGIFSAATAILFFCHLLALAIYAGIILAFEMTKPWEDKGRRYTNRRQHWIVLAAQFWPVALLWMLQPEGSMNWSANYVSPMLKLFTVTAPFRYFFEPVDVAIITFFFTALTLGLWTRTLSFAKEARLALFGLLVLAIVLPHLFMGIFAVDQRMAVVAALLAITSARIALPSFRSGVILASIVSSLFVWRVVTLSIDWQFINKGYAEFRTAASALPPGANLLVARRDASKTRADWPAGSSFAIWHLASLAVVDRAAFVPLTFTTRYQPIKLHPRKQAFAGREGQPLSYEYMREGVKPSGDTASTEMTTDGGNYWDHWHRNFDYVLVLDHGEAENPVPGLLKNLHTGTFFSIYKNTTR
jgi:hypothetical protein